MEKFELMDKQNIYDLKELLENDSMIFDNHNLVKFVETEGSYGFIYQLDNKPIGFAYGCRLIKPDGFKELYLHSIDILPKYQNQGYGTRFIKNILSFAKENGFYKLFLCSSKSLQNACHMYEKCGGIRECNDEVIYSYDLIS